VISPHRPVTDLTKLGLSQVARVVERHYSEHAIGVSKDVETGIVLSDAPIVSIIQTQQPANQHLVDDLMSYQQHRLTNVTGHQLGNSSFASFQHNSQILTAGQCDSVRRFQPLMVDFGVAMSSLGVGHALPLAQVQQF
jgi:hypothetical protein